MALFFKKTKKGMIMTEEDEKVFENITIRRFCEKEIIDNKVRDHCHLTGEYRSPIHNTCNLNIKQKDCNFIPFIFHNFSICDCYLFFKKLVDEKNDKVKFDNIPKTNEE